MPKSKLENITDIMVGLTICVCISAFLVSQGGLGFPSSTTADYLLAISTISLLIGLFILVFKLAITPYFISRSFQKNCIRGIHFGQSDVKSSDRHAEVYGKCMYCGQVISLKQYKIVYEGGAYFFTAPSMVGAIRSLQNQIGDHAGMSGVIFHVVDLSAVTRRELTYVITESGSLDVLK